MNHNKRKIFKKLEAAWRADRNPFTITFLTGAYPEAITLGASYTGPADASLAEYDAGDGVWQTYTSNTITRSGEYIAFRGDWRTSLGNYSSLFDGSLDSTAYTCKFSGMMGVKPNIVANVYSFMFRACSAVTSIKDNPFPILSGAPAANMFRETCRGMSRVAGALPEGFMDTSGLTGAPAANMLQEACMNMSQVTSLPDGFMDTSGLFGAPAVSMFQQACQGITGLTDAYVFHLGADITFTPANVASALLSAFRNMGQWNGQVMWGAAVLVEAIPIPNADTNAFLGSTNMPNYATINANWK